MQASLDYDVLIIGAGFTGLSLALALAQTQLGWRIGIIESKAILTPENAEINPDGRAIALAYGSYLILKKLNLWEGLAPCATPIEKVHVSRQGRFGITRLSAQDMPLPALAYVVPAERLQALLQNQVLAHPDIEMLDNTQLIDLDCTATGSQVSLLRHNATHPEQRLASLVIAADGTHSHARDKQGIHTKALDTDNPQAALVVRVQSSKPHQQVAYERFLPQGVLALLPAPQGAHFSTAIWTDTPQAIDARYALDEQAFLATLQKHFGGRLGQFIQLGKRYHYPITPQLASEQIAPGFVLLGNAAHTLHPVAAQGFNLTLRDTKALVEVLQQGYHDQHALGDLALLRRYIQQRQQDQQRTQRLTSGLLGLFAAAGSCAPLGLLSGVGLMGLDMLPVFRRYLMDLPLGF